MPKTLTPKNQPETSPLKRALIDGPGEQTLRNIFAYAKALKVMHTKTTGAVTVIMN